MITPSSITSTSTPNDNLNYNTFATTHKSTILPDRFLTANLFQNKKDYAESSSYYSDQENDLVHSVPSPITDHPRKANKPINFGNNNNYIINTATPNFDNDYLDNNRHDGQITKDTRDTQHEITENVTMQTNKFLENMEHNSIK